MAITETVQALVNSQNSLLQLQNRLVNQGEVMKEESLQTFIFDLRDYADSLRVVTDLMEPTEIPTLEVEEISAVLSKQNKWLRELIDMLETLEDNHTPEAFFGLSEGEIRRLKGSLQGVVELNTLNLQDNLTFQRVFKDKGYQLSKTVAPQSQDTKPSFLKRLFGKTQ